MTVCACVRYPYVHCFCVHGLCAAGGGSGGNDTNCPICLEQIECPAITPCGHIFCKECIYTLVYEASTEGSAPP